MAKEFLHPLTVRDNAIVLAEKMQADNFVPTVIYVSLRGGAPFGNVISEYFKLATPKVNTPLYAAVVAHSYTAFASGNVRIDGWTYPPEFIRPNDYVALIDDIFDSGKTMNVIAKEIMRQGVSRDRLKVVVHDFKVRTFLNQKHEIIPDYYSRKLIINSPEEDDWIHSLSHELEGLTDKELFQKYKPTIAEKIKKLLKLHKSFKK